MKILIFLIKWKGGVGGGIKNISEELINQGHSVKVISREEDLNFKSFFKSFFKIRRYLINLMAKEKYDIIYTQDWSLAFSLLFPFKIFKSQHFCMFHGNQYSFAGIIQNFVGRKMGNHLLCMAPSLKKRFPNSNLVYCGVNIQKFYPLNKKRKYLGWIEKGTETISRLQIEEISKKIKMPLKIAKEIPYERMNELFYNQCKLFISLPPKTAGFQASWLEAMASGIPLVIGNNNGAGELQPFYKINSPNALEIVNLIKKMKKKDYRKWIIENNFTWENHTKKIIRIFEKN